MPRPPNRCRNVFFLGAGFSCTARLPNTAQLLTEAHRLARDKQTWGISKRLGERLEKSYKFFYPTRGPGFRPDVVDFFGVLSSYLQIAAVGLPDGFADRSLLADLRFSIVHVLCDALKGVSDNALREPHSLLDRMIAKGNTVVTTNWDTLIENACDARKVPYRLWGPPEDAALTILKLHGSIDWVLRDHAKKNPAKENYARLEELENSSTARRRNLTDAQVLRVLVRRPGAVWQTIKGASREPYMITMAPGKADALGPLLPLWESAYRAIGAAKALEIVGYSMPADDIEIRTLLRAGVRRGPKDPEVLVRNPAPDVHVRVREMIHGKSMSDYAAVPDLV